MGSLLLVSMAHALSTFPGIVSDHLGMPCTPSCLLCHETPAGGSGTATQPFVANLEAEGFTFVDSATLTAGLDAVQAGDYDADGDGVNDVEELIVGANPNPDGIDFCTVDAPPAVTRGCFAESGTTAGTAGLAAWAFALRQSRRKSVRESR